MKKGFTMIELIFVIVILGILAAVAIPRLAATRDDAQVARLTSNLATLIADAGARWTAQGSWPTNWSEMTNVPFVTSANATITAPTAVGTEVYLGTGSGDSAQACYSVKTATNGVLVVKTVNASSSVCTGAQTATQNNNLSAAAGSELNHTFGGSRVKF